jgi:CubicO group peptidase (beta-lactamase class C family)
MAEVESALAGLLNEGVESGVFPGAVAGVSVRGAAGERRVFVHAGRLEPEGASTVVSTPYDLASLTKPVVATTALRLVMHGALVMDHPAARYVPELEGTPAGEASIAQLLSHRAGLTPWGGLYKDVPAGVGSAATRAFVLREAATRVDPSPPARGSVYSDLGYLVAGEVVARASGRTLDAAVKREVTEPLGLTNELFYAASLPTHAQEALREHVAPTELCSFRQRVLRGEVHDENCAAYGGIAGHAGLFGSVHGVLTFGRAMLDVLEGRSLFLDRALLAWALMPRAGGGYVVGWDTRSAQGSSAGSLYSARAFGHLGFTGTSIWCDPARSLCAVLLTNRVHPTRDNIKIREFRPRFHDALVSAWFGSM